MGNCCRSFCRRGKLRRHIVLLLIGLDNAGKTKTVNNLAGEKDDKVLPTVGFKAVNLVHKDTPVTIYDLGGGPHFRQIWSQYYSEVHGIIFVIDSSDFSRLDECKAVLEEVLSHDKISGKPVLILANKQDKSGALDDIDVVEKLNIEPLVNRYRCPTLVESYTANVESKNTKKPKIDPGLKKGYQWLLNYITRRYGDINLRVQTDIHSDLERRKRMSKASNRASQTFTAISDDIATQTGFENPNFGLGKVAEGDENHVGDMGNVIVVKPITHKPNSVDIDTTITIESLDDSDTSGAKPKLSPLFGASNSSTTETAPIELESRTEFRKLSPIIRNSCGANRHIDFMNRPQSSPSSGKDLKLGTSTRNSSIQEEELKLNAKELNMQLGDINGWEDVDKSHRVHVKDAELTMNREIVLTDRAEYLRSSSSATAVITSATLPAARPVSASQLVRRHLELTSMHKRRLSLRHFPNMHRNKTSPEQMSLFLYEPKSSQRQYDKGDFQHASNN